MAGFSAISSPLFSWPVKKILDEEQSIAQAVRARRRQHYSTLTHVLSHSLKENHPRVSLPFIPPPHSNHEAP